MGFLNIPKQIKERVRADYNFDVIEWDDFVEDSELGSINFENSDIEEEAILTAELVNPAHQRRSSERKSKPQSHNHFGRRKRGIRGKRRYENMCYLLSLVDNVDASELDDNDDSKTAFSELFVDKEKMKIWNDFVSLSEEKQCLFLETHCDKSRADKLECSQTKDVDMRPYVAFNGIDQKIKDYLRSKALAKEILKSFEEDILSTMTEFPNTVLLINVPSSYSRILVHGICQYSGLHAFTHKYGSECLMEIEIVCNTWTLPPQTLSNFLS